ncbi:MAG: DUF420 domain-containing protein [Halobacteriovoraceae bacterium]|nr:DUF420 domain-containing protein [Halobacteriovoraceae bacterium]MCB9094002.1 DUF420 domain-containing protein [Halobacteriovoraceae bacterium]
MLKKFEIWTLLSVSLVAIIFLFWLIYGREANSIEGMTFLKSLSFLNAGFNFMASVFLVLGYKKIKNKEIEAHKKCMGTAFVFSALFLVSYITYHTFHGDQKFLGEGVIRPIYFFILISHIFLSVVALPMVLMTFYAGLKSKLVFHKKMAVWTFPIWLYVSVTGVLIVVLFKFYSS